MAGSAWQNSTGLDPLVYVCLLIRVGFGLNSSLSGKKDCRGSSLVVVSGTGKGAFL